MILETAYVRPTMLRSQIRGEVSARLRMAVHDRALSPLVKYGSLALVRVPYKALRAVRRAS
jgi:hypothetical protein